MDQNRQQSDVQERTPRRQVTFWTDYGREVKHLEIDYSVREREKQISLLVDDGGFKFAVFFVAASGFLASSFSLFATNVINTSLFYVYPGDGRLGDRANLVLDEITLVGMIFGMLAMGHFADRAGRKRLYGVELALVIVATFGIIQASDGVMMESDKHSMDIYSWLTWWRSVLGCGIGAEYPLSAIITAEWASTQSRGTMLAAVFLMQSVSRLLVDGLSLGILVSTRLKWDLSQNDSGSGSKMMVDQVWRWTVGVGIIPAAIAIIMRLTIPETPRYYAGIMKDLRKAVRNTLRVYHNASVSEKAPKTSSITGRGHQNNGDDGRAPWYSWYIGAWGYLTGPKKEWRTLTSISLLWALLDVCFYGLSMDLSNDLSILFHDPSKNTQGCPKDLPWNSDWWNCDPIYTVLSRNSRRFIWLASMPAVVGGIVAILIINSFRRKHILAATFVVISVLLAIAGASLIVTADLRKSHVITQVIYAILSFVFNLGPNTLIFVIAAEIFPTVYRGTFFGVAAAAGKAGAAVVRVITEYTPHREVSFGIRLLVFIPLMLVSAFISWYLPDVQMPTVSSHGDAVSDLEQQQNGPSGTQRSPESAVGNQGQTNGLGDELRADRSSSESSVDEERLQLHAEPGAKRLSIFRKLENKALEDIASNPSRDKGV